MGSPALATDLSAAAPAISLRTPQPRVAILADYQEEGWLSMDYVAEMWHEAISGGNEFRASLLRPRMARRLHRLPLVGRTAPMTRADRFWSRFVDYPKWLGGRALNHDLFHIVDHSYAHLALHLPPGRVVVSCHDIDAFRCLLPNPAGTLTRPWWFRAFTRRILAGLRAAARVICVSQTVQRELIATGLVPAERTSVIHTGIHPSCSALPHARADHAAAELLGPFDDTIDLLHVGSVVPRKGIETLLRIVAEVKVKQPNVRLIRVGGPFTASQTSLVQELNLGNCIRALPYLERDVLAAVYRRATLVVQPSILEGFGLPVAEALACGAAVVASDIPVFHEVGGDAVCYCPLSDIQSWTGAVLSLIEERRQDPSRAELRSRTARERASLFSWMSHAGQLQAVYRQILSSAAQDDGSHARITNR